MSHQDLHRKVEEAVQGEIPDTRCYDSESAAQVDRKLCEAISAAKNDGNHYLAELLRYELGSHYYQKQ